MDVFGALLLVVAGSFVGGIARHLLSDLTVRWLGGRFPWGTLVVNVSGCLAIGVTAALIPPAAAGGLARDFVVFGLLGGYTTVSSFALQTLALAHDGEGVKAGFNVAVSTGLCLLAVAAGYGAGAALSGGAIS